jgi:hypothetical protein
MLNPYYPLLRQESIRTSFLFSIFSILLQQIPVLLTIEI